MRKTLVVMIFGLLSFNFGWTSNIHSGDKPRQTISSQRITEIRKENITKHRDTKPVPQKERSNTQYSNRPTERIASRSINYREYQTTAYTWTGNRTASGTWPKVGRTIAINPAKFKLGDRIYLQNFGWRIAEDIIPPDSVEKGADIDIYFGRGKKAVQEAKEHGRKMLRVYK